MNNNLICIYSETSESIEDIILKIYEILIDNELEKVDYF